MQQDNRRGSIHLGPKVDGFNLESGEMRLMLRLWTKHRAPQSTTNRAPSQPESTNNNDDQVHFLAVTAEVSPKMKKCDK